MKSIGEDDDEVETTNEDAGEEEEENVASEEGFVETTDIHDRAAADIYRVGRSTSTVTEDEIEKYLKERYRPKGRGNRDEYDDTDQTPDESTRQSLLSEVKSTNLCPIKFRKGEKKQTAILFMQKYLVFQIKSVVVEEGDRGCIYIEAFKSDRVKASCEDIRALSVQNLQTVSIKAMMDILRVVKRTYGIKKNVRGCV